MTRSIAAVAVAGLLMLGSSHAAAQTIYEPVQYQYGEGANRYYYGGNDPAVFDTAERQACLDRLGDFAYDTDRYTHAYVHRRLIGQLERVYSDCAPYVNARAYGYLPVDAANDANANVPRYFRMRDLDRAAVVRPDGTRVVAAQARPVASDRDRAAADAARAATRPAAKTIIIIPRKAKTSDKQVASAAR
jgi:hypothetical protein